VPLVARAHVAHTPQAAHRQHSKGLGFLNPKKPSTLNPAHTPHAAHICRQGAMHHVGWKDGGQMDQATGSTAKAWRCGDSK
jgi:hypothetical protein